MRRLLPAIIFGSLLIGLIGVAEKALAGFTPVPTPAVTPAGSTTQVQYNNAGAFGASSGFVTDSSGNVTALTLNKLTLTVPATSATITITNGKTLAVTKTLTLSGTDSTTMTFPTTSATIARTDAANTFTGHQTIEGVTTTGATGTGNLVFSAAPTLTGATTFGTFLTTAGLAIGSNNVAATAQIATDVVIGSGATDSATSSNAIAIGPGATTGKAQSVAVGVNSNASSNFSTALGPNAVINNNTADQSIAIGFNAIINAAGDDQIAIGHTATGLGAGDIALGGVGTAANQFVVGGSSANNFITDGFFGNGVTNTAPQNYIQHATSGSGSNVAGADYSISSQGTGSASGGTIHLMSSLPGGSATTLRTAVNCFATSPPVTLTDGATVNISVAVAARIQTLSSSRTTLTITTNSTVPMYAGQEGFIAISSTSGTTTVVTIGTGFDVGAIAGTVTITTGKTAYIQWVSPDGTNVDVVNVQNGY